MTFKLKNSSSIILLSFILAFLDLQVLNKLHNDRNTQYKKIIPYPMVHRDIAILVDSNIKHSEIQKVIFSLESLSFLVFGGRARNG